MKKDAVFYGSISVFSAFILMIVWTVWDAIRVTKQAAYRAGAPTESVVETQRQEFSTLVTTTGDDGAIMVLVSEGIFPMGSADADGDPDEMPKHPVYISAFYIDQLEVTNGQFERFRRVAHYPQPSVPVFQDDINKITAPELPVIGISWEMARGYCEWAGKRLPTESEWEKAARGERGFRWPWGSRFGEGLANTEGAEDGFPYTAPPGRFELGRSSFGVYDMAGNVAEWTADWYSPSSYSQSVLKDPKGPESGTHRVYRGGSWNDSSLNVRSAKRFAAAPHQTSAVIGFRCAKSVPKL